MQDDYLKMSETESLSLFGALSHKVGTSEPALKLLLTIVSGYPLALIHRKFFYGKPANVQHLFFMVTGFGLGFFNYGFEIFHAVFAVFFSYLTLFILRGSEVCVAVTFLFNMIYLLIGYYYAATNDYDINWTLPQCVLVLRLISCAFDMYDGKQPKEKLSALSKELGLHRRPTLLEYCGHMFFPASFLVGPQFPMKRYNDFVAGEFSSTDDKTLPPNCIQPAVKRFLLGVMYLSIYQVVGTYVNDDYIISDEFADCSFMKRCLLLGIWGRITLYKYISCWLLTEGACIMFGLTYNGKKEDGTVLWDGLANVDIIRLETATEFNHYIMSFNCNTNHWVAQYVYKRLKFLGNRLISQAAALLFLAIWHGFHTGYYVCFFFEFIVMYLEKDLQSILKKNPHLANKLKAKYMPMITFILLRIYTFVFMGWCLLPFALLTFGKYWKAYQSVNYAGIVLFVLWPIIYSPLIRYIAKVTRAPERAHAE